MRKANAERILIVRPAIAAGTAAYHAKPHLEK